MRRNPRPWTKEELALVGTLSDAKVAELTDRTFGTVWQKRRALGIEHGSNPQAEATSRKFFEAALKKMVES